MAGVLCAHARGDVNRTSDIASRIWNVGVSPAHRVCVAGGSGFASVAIVAGLYGPYVAPARGDAQRQGRQAGYGPGDTIGAGLGQSCRAAHGHEDALVLCLFRVACQRLDCLFGHAWYLTRSAGILTDLDERVSGNRHYAIAPTIWKAIVANQAALTVSHGRSYRVRGRCAARLWRHLPAPCLRRSHQQLGEAWRLRAKMWPACSLVDPAAASKLPC